MGLRKARRFLQPDRLIWPLLLLLLAERLLIFRELGVDYLSYSDDIAYLESGITFAKTGMITVWGPYPSAMIMPAMPVLLGLLSLLFGEGTGYLLAAKLLWILMGVATAYAAYRTAAFCSNGWGGLLAAGAFALPNLAWMNHVVLTETPYMLFFTLCVYYTFRMGRSAERKYFAGYLLSFMAALMFRANIMTMLLFTGAWLLFRQRGRRKLLCGRGLLLLCAMALFMIPWGLRNLRVFGEFIPLTNGAGNPMLLGTYQGEGYPTDEELDYETNVDAVMRQRYPGFYNEEPEPYAESDWYTQKFDPTGEVKELKDAQYLRLKRDGIIARYRLREWWARNPKSLLKSYLLIKPRWMLNWTWYWSGVFGVSYEALHRVSQINLLLCLAALALAFWKKRYRGPLSFLTLIYAANVYIYSLAFVTDRYASTLMVLRYLIVGIGGALVIELLQSRKPTLGAA